MTECVAERNAPADDSKQTYVRRASLHASHVRKLPYKKTDRSGSIQWDVTPEALIDSTD